MKAKAKNWYVVEVLVGPGPKYEAWKLYDFEPLGGIGWGAKGPPRSFRAAVNRAALLSKVAKIRACAA